MVKDDKFLDSTDFLISYSEFLFLLSVIVKPVDQPVSINASLASHIAQKLYLGFKISEISIKDQ